MKPGPDTLPRDSFDFLKALVDINTSTDHPDGLDVARRELARAFEAAGYPATEQDLGNRRKLISFRARDARPRLSLVGHLDTVFKKTSAFQKLTVGADGSLRGPGVIDMKGGIVLMLDVLRDLRAAGLDRHIQVVINDDEETGSLASRDALQKITRDTPCGLVFEPGLADGAVVISHSGVKWYRLTVHGLAAHAGLEPEEGINAAVELSHKILKLDRLNDLPRGLSLNPGTLAGGTKANVICDEAHVTLDLRFPDEEALARAEGELERIRAESVVFNPKLKRGTVSTLEPIAQLPAMPARSTARVFGLLERAAEKLGQKVAGRHVGYASDGNHLAQSGMDLLVGVGPYGGGMHSQDEFMRPESYPERRALSAELIRLALSELK